MGLFAWEWLTYVSVFHQRTEHEDAGAAMFPHHPPEVGHCVAHGALGHDELVPAVVTLATRFEKVIIIW